MVYHIVGLGCEEGGVRGRSEGEGREEEDEGRGGWSLEGLLKAVRVEHTELCHALTPTHIHTHTVSVKQTTSDTPDQATTTYPMLSHTQ